MSEPYCLAMVLCDAVHRDPATGKSTILGTFATLGATDFPVPVRLAVYWAITDAVGDVELTFRLVDSAEVFDESAKPVFELSFETHSPSPLSVNEGSLTLSEKVVQLPRPGVYHCEMLHKGEVLMSRRLVALQLSMTGEVQDE